MPLFSDPELEIIRNHSSFGICKFKKKKKRSKNKNRKEKYIYI